MAAAQGQPDSRSTRGRWLAVLAVLAIGPACGRVHFDELRDGAVDAAPDAPKDGEVPLLMGRLIHRWTSRLPTTATSKGINLVTDPAGNVYVIGRFMEMFGSTPSAGDWDMFLVSLSRDGTPRWAHTFGGPGDDQGHGIALGPDGSLYVTGMFTGTVDFGGQELVGLGDGDGFVASYTADGALRWVKRFGGLGATQGADIATTGDGSLYVTGTFEGMLDLGDPMPVSAGGRDTFVSRLTPDGLPVWVRRFGGDGADDGLAIAVGGGRVTVVGSFRSDSVPFAGDVLRAGLNFNGLVLSFAMDGSPQWGLSLGAADADYVADVVAMPGGEACLMGSFFETVQPPGAPPLTSAGNLDVLLACLGPDGTTRWAERFGGTGIDEGGPIAAAPGGAFLIAGGDFMGTLDLGGGPLVSSGIRSNFLATFAPEGSHLWSRSTGGDGYDVIIALTTGLDGTVYALGQGTADFGGPEGPGGPIFIAAFDPARAL